MMMFRTHKRVFVFAPLIAAVALVTACDDDPVEPPDEHADEVAVMQLTVGDQTIDVTESGTDETIMIPIGDTSVSAVFLDDDGDEVEVHDDEFELRMESVDTGIVTYTPTDSFNGTLAGVTDGATFVSVELFHLEEGHADFGPHDVSVTVE